MFPRAKWLLINTHVEMFNATQTYKLSLFIELSKKKKKKKDFAEYWESRVITEIPATGISAWRVLT